MNFVALEHTAVINAHLAAAQKWNAEGDLRRLKASERGPLWQRMQVSAIRCYRKARQHSDRAAEVKKALQIYVLASFYGIEKKF